MVRALFFALALPAIASAAVCTQTDLLPLANAMLTCTSASGVSLTTLQNKASPADIVKMCQFPACQSFFKSFETVKCTDPAGNSLALLGNTCSVSTTAKPTTSGVATVFLSTGAVVAATIVSMM